MRSLLSILILFSGAAGSAVVKDKLNCSDKELVRMDCRLRAAGYSLRLLAKSVAWNDGTWQTVDEMPLKGEAMAWEKVHFELLGGWPILQLWLWDKGVGELQIESLHWYVADAEKRHLTILAEGPVRKRRPEGEPQKKPKFLYDATEPHALKKLANGDLEWQLGGQKKTLAKLKTRTR
jgi:hypothetical protein